MVQKFVIYEENLASFKSGKKYLCKYLFSTYGAYITENNSERPGTT